VEGVAVPLCPPLSSVSLTILIPPCLPLPIGVVVTEIEVTMGGGDVSPRSRSGGDGVSRALSLPGVNGRSKALSPRLRLRRPERLDRADRPSPDRLPPRRIGGIGSDAGSVPPVVAAGSMLVRVVSTVRTSHDFREANVLRLRRRTDWSASRSSSVSARLPRLRSTIERRRADMTLNVSRVLGR